MSPPSSEPPPALGLGDAYFRSAFEDAAIPTGLAALDGQWLRVNRSLCELVGRSEAELMALTFQAITHPDDLATDLAHLARLLAGEIRSYSMEKRYVHKDGHAVWILLSASLARAADGAPLYFIAQIQDISERKQAEAALRASELRFRLIVEHMRDVLYIAASGGDQSVYVSPAYEEVWGRPASELETSPRLWIEAIHPEDRERVIATLADTSPAPHDVVYRIVRPDGTTRWIHDRAFAVVEGDAHGHRVGIAEDITERWHARARLDESEQRYRSLFMHHPDAVFSMDLEGRFVSANPACQTVSGYEPESLLGQHFGPLVVPEYLEAAQAHFRAAATGAAQAYEVAIRHKSGHRVDLAVTSIPIIIHGAVVGVFGIAKDLTTQHSLEAQLRQAQKMEAVGRLAGGIAHDFNNLLTGILSHAELVLGELPDGPVRQDAEVIRETAQRAAVLTRQLLAFSRKQVVEPRLLDLNAVVAGTEQMLRRTLGAGVTLEADLGAVGSVLADPGQLEQVLLNLVVNARDAMPGGGQLTLRTRDLVVDDAFARRHRGLRTGAYVALSAEDTGVGMPHEIQSRIFEPFFTTKPVGRGTGLGLSTVYGIVKQWGGYVAVQSAPGRGTTFTVYVPRQDGAPEAGAQGTAERLPTGTETILVVEDEAQLRSSIRRILTRYGYSVLEARHGADALRVADDPATCVDLVMTDLVMPEMGGRELIAQLRARSSGLRIVAMSGYDEQAAIRGEALPPGTSFLEKPFTIEGLLRTVRSALDAAAEPA